MIAVKAGKLCDEAPCKLNVSSQNRSFHEQSSLETVGAMSDGEVPDGKRWVNQKQELYCSSSEILREMRSARSGMSLFNTGIRMSQTLKRSWACRMSRQRRNTRVCVIFNLSHPAEP